MFLLTGTQSTIQWAGHSRSTGIYLYFHREIDNGTPPGDSHLLPKLFIQQWHTTWPAGLQTISAKFTLTLESERKERDAMSAPGRTK